MILGSSRASTDRVIGSARWRRQMVRSMLSQVVRARTSLMLGEDVLRWPACITMVDTSVKRLSWLPWTMLHASAGLDPRARGSRVGSWHCVHPVVPAGIRQMWADATREDRASSWEYAQAGCARRAVEAVPGDAAH